MRSRWTAARQMSTFIIRALCQDGIMEAPAATGRVTRRGIASESARLIREAIMKGTFQPGDQLLEVELAESLDVSRGSVRQGLSILEREGLVRTAWHRPATVVATTRSRANDLYTLRIGLERIAARGAAEAREPGADLEAALTDLRVAVEGGADRAELIERDLDFHDAVYARAANEPLADAWQAIRSQVQLFQMLRSEGSGRSYAESLIGEHLIYARLVHDGDADGAICFAEGHIRGALGALLEHLPE